MNVIAAKRRGIARHNPFLIEYFAWYNQRKLNKKINAKNIVKKTTYGQDITTLYSNPVSIDEAVTNLEKLENVNVDFFDKGYLSLDAAPGIKWKVNPPQQGESYMKAVTTVEPENIVVPYEFRVLSEPEQIGECRYKKGIEEIVRPVYSQRPEVEFRMNFDDFNLGEFNDFKDAVFSQGTDAIVLTGDRLEHMPAVYRATCSINTPRATLKYDID